MNKLTALAVLGLLSVVPVAAQAEEQAAPATTEAAAPAADVAAEAAVVAPEVKEVTLKDGTKVSIEGENVFVVGADGAKTPAPDGEHVLADDTKVKTMGGKLVKEEAAPAPEAAPATEGAAE